MDDAVARIKDKIDIAEYIGRSVTLKKAGRNFTGLCPFHTENSPSFNVSPERGVFKCFGCGVSGDLFTFLMQRDGLTFSEALKSLAQEAGVDLEENSSKQFKQQKSVEEKYYEMHELAGEYYHYLLTQHEVGKEAREYLEKRGLVLENITTGKEPHIISEFKIGYAPKSWDALGNYLLKKGYRSEDIIACGLGVKSPKGTGSYDMFRGRVMFPLYNKSGRIVGFAGRVLGSDKTAKYINTAETAIFHKREFLFGYYQAKDAIRRKGEVILVEGEMDMLSSYRVGVKNVVAVKGSALTSEQIELLGRVCNRLLLCFDSDFAGDKAMRKAIELAESKGMEIKVIQISGAKDPDECIKKGVEKWISAISEATPYYDFLIQSAFKRYDGKDPFGKRSILSELGPHILSIKDVIIRSHYIQKLSTLLDVSEDSLLHMTRGATDYARQRAPVMSKPQQTASPLAHAPESVGKLSGVAQMERYFLALLLRMKSPLRSLEKKIQLEDIHDKNVKKVYNLYIDFFAQHPDSYIDEFLQFTADTEVLAVIDDIFLIDVPFENDDELSKELFVTIKQLKTLVLKERIRLVSLEIKQAELSGDTGVDLVSLQKEIFSLHERLGRVQRMD